MNASYPRLPLWQASLWVLLGGGAAQLAGGMMASTLRSLRGAHAAGGSGLSVELVVPALVASAGSLLAVALIAPWVAGLPIRDALGLRPAPPACFVAAALGTVMLGPAADALMRGMETLLPQLNLGVVALLHQLVRDVPLVVAWPVFALLPGLAEELMFRGLLQTAAGHSALAIVISALAFAIFHIDPHHIAGVLPLGFFLSWVASRCGTLVTIFAHVVNNSVAIAVVHSESFDVGYGTDAPMPWTWLPASLALVAISGWIVMAHTPPRAGIIPVSEPDEL
jgi:membrane protease YdiL (CAAX protease family)